MESEKSIPIGIIGDFDASRPTHVATEAGLSHAATELGVDVEASWLPTHARLEMPLESFAGFLVAPGSPSGSVDGALRAIRYARERARPLLGTCGGFQHVILEFARNVLGLQKAAHAEYEPHAAELVIEPLTCSLSGQRAAVFLKPGSTAAICIFTCFTPPCLPRRKTSAAADSGFSGRIRTPSRRFGAAWHQSPSQSL